ncbi:hypothetical protein [Intestinibacillus massiliensis]|uniref:hypothetical protein n=1 Tax=Intestinibacillus massiliensis TaxID=1871029 RepID=UPI0013565A7A|nr:hypothetical protein [Intestinibacillus massiliensis]
MARRIGFELDTKWGHETSVLEYDDTLDKEIENDLYRWMWNRITLRRREIKNGQELGEG